MKTSTFAQRLGSLTWHIETVVTSKAVFVGEFPKVHISKISLRVTNKFNSLAISLVKKLHELEESNKTETIFDLEPKPAFRTRTAQVGKIASLSF
ncbi:hypothetical protein JTE90_010803 [Oedothorax gibbosus]|uniref:Uncharacterized protein n=1 Tax=Oedothorax gibbosus TaxID=931172 RepID=A0AAV6VH90_9ARAC|nr:hypothetical protein JTE90_010803 [Oedothorax gibbosus]